MMHDQWCQVHHTDCTLPLYIVKWTSQQSMYFLWWSGQQEGTEKRCHSLIAYKGQGVCFRCWVTSICWLNILLVTFSLLILFIIVHVWLSPTENRNSWMWHAAHVVRAHVEDNHGSGESLAMADLTAIYDKRIDTLGFRPIKCNTTRLCQGGCGMPDSWHQIGTKESLLVSCFRWWPEQSCS